MTLPRAAWNRLRSLLPTRNDVTVATRHPGRDLLAGLTVAVVALPLALGFGVSTGLGAAAGLATAVVAGTLAAIFGGSNLQVSGPTGAMTVVLVPIVAAHGAGGVLTVGLLAGLILVALALAQAGRYMRYVPAPVVEGFTLGIAIVIFLQQLPSALGVSHPGGETILATSWHALTGFAHHPNWTAFAIALGVASIMLVGGRWRPGLPFSLIGILVATICVQVFHLASATTLGRLPAGLPAPSLGFLDLSTLSTLLPSAVAVAALAALESLLSASVADGMTVDQKHDPDRELFGQGLANIAAPLFGGVPATGAIARTAVNVRAGAGSRLAALTHAAVLAIIVYAAAPLVSFIPLAALAGVLLATAIRMIEVGSVKAMLRATRHDAAVLILTAAATVVLDLVYAVILGLLIAGALALRTVAHQARLDQVSLLDDLPTGTTDEEHDLLAEHIVAYRIEGPLFFGAAHRFLLELTELAAISAVILRMSRVTTIDATGTLVLKDTIDKLEHRGIAVYISGIRDGHHQPLEALGVFAHLDARGHVYATTPEAITAARQQLHLDGTLPTPPSPPGEAAANPRS